jgi:hypothetical protein
MILFALNTICFVDVIRIFGVDYSGSRGLRATDQPNNQIQMLEQGVGAAIYIGDTVAGGPVHDCICEDIDGSAMWLDTPQSEVLRTCGRKCETTNSGAFAFMSGVHTPSSNRRVSYCSIFQCGAANSRGNGAVATDKDLIKVQNVNFTACQASSSSATWIGSPEDNGGYGQLESEFLIVTRTTSAQQAIGFSSLVLETSYVNHSASIGNIVLRVIIHTEGPVIRISFCVFDGNSVSTGPEVSGTFTLIKNN